MSSYIYSQKPIGDDPENLLRAYTYLEKVEGFEKVTNQIKKKLIKLFSQVPVNKKGYKQLGSLRYYCIGLCEFTKGCSDKIILEPFEFTPKEKKDETYRFPDLKFVNNHSYFSEYILKEKFKRKYAIKKDLKISLVGLIDKILEYRKLDEKSKDEYIQAYLILEDIDENRILDQIDYNNLLPDDYDFDSFWSSEEKEIVLYYYDLNNLLSMLTRKNYRYKENYLSIPNKDHINKLYLTIAEAVENKIKRKDIVEMVGLNSYCYDNLIPYNNKIRSPFDLYNCINTLVTDKETRIVLYKFGMLREEDIEKEESTEFVDIVDTVTEEVIDIVV